MFLNALNDIEAVFGGSDWTANNIKTIPDNYQGSIQGATEYVLVKVMPSGSETIAHAVERKISGLLAVKIFVPAGYGQRRLMEVSDLLDNVLQHKQLTNITLGSSYLNVEGLDPQNESLYSGSYIIPFTSYGE